MHGRHLALTNKQKSSWQVAVVVLASKPCKQPDSKMETVTVRLFGFAGEWEFALFESYCKIGNFPQRILSFRYSLKILRSYLTNKFLIGQYF